MEEESMQDVFSEGPDENTEQEAQEVEKEGELGLVVVVKYVWSPADRNSIPRCFGEKF